MTHITDYIQSGLTKIFKSKIDAMEKECAEFWQAQISDEKEKYERLRMSFEWEEQKAAEEKELRLLWADVANRLGKTLIGCGDCERIYHAIADSLDPEGFNLFRTAEKLLGCNVGTYYIFEENTGKLDHMDGNQLLPWAEAIRYGEIRFMPVLGACCERVEAFSINEKSKEYMQYRAKLFEITVKKLLCIR